MGVGGAEKWTFVRKKCSVVSGLLGWSGKTVATALVQKENFSETLSCGSIKILSISFISA